MPTQSPNAEFWVSVPNASRESTEDLRVRLFGQLVDTGPWHGLRGVSVTPAMDQQEEEKRRERLMAEGNETLPAGNQTINFFVVVPLITGAETIAKAHELIRGQLRQEGPLGYRRGLLVRTRRTGALAQDYRRDKEAKRFIAVAKRAAKEQRRLEAGIRPSKSLKGVAKTTRQASIAKMQAIADGTWTPDWKFAEGDSNAA